MSFEPTLFGGTEWKGNIKTEVDAVIAEFPHAVHDRGLLLSLMLRRRCPWVSQLGEQKINELRAFFRDFESIRRRTQDIRVEKFPDS